MKRRKRNAGSTRLLIFVAGAALVLALVNLFATLNLYRKVGALPGQVLVVEQPTGELSPTVEATQPSRLQVSIDDDPVKGSRHAPVTIVEFSEFQCSYCARFAKETLPLIEKDYVSTGEVRLVYRDYPLRNHRYAQKAAEAAECADEQAKFWEYHDTLYENQHALDVASLGQYAKDLGLDSGRFEKCLNSREIAAEVQKDLRDGQTYGVRGTPTFFINGIKVAGAKPYQVFQRIIEQELRR